MPVSRRSLLLTAVLAATLVAAAAAPRPDPRAVEIARRTLLAVEDGWALGRYDQAARVRVALNLRGGGPTPVGLTANAVLDRDARRYRADVAGDVGPLTLWVDPRRATLYVPTLQQVARRPAGSLAPGARVGRSLLAEVRAMRANLDAGYGGLVFGGEEELEGVRTFRIHDTPAPGTTATYWIDAARHLPRRIAIAGAGRRPTRIDFAYGTGPRPTRIDATVPGVRDLQATVTPSYDGSGRVVRLHVDTRVAGGGAYAADLVLDWSPRIGGGFLEPAPPAAAREVSFDQLAGGVLLSAAGTLGGLASALIGATGMGSR